MKTNIIACTIISTFVSSAAFAQNAPTLETATATPATAPAPAPEKPAAAETKSEAHPAASEKQEVTPAKGDQELDAMKPADNKKTVKDHHLETPDFLEDKLNIRMGFGLGFGTKEFDADRMGFHLEADYFVTDFAFAGLKHSSVSGVKTNSDFSYVAQSYLVGGGYKFTLNPKMSVRAAGFAGFSRLTSWDLVFFSTGKKEYGLATATTASFDYEIVEKLYATCGAGIQVGKAAWYDAQVGVSAFF